MPSQLSPIPYEVLQQHIYNDSVASPNPDNWEPLVQVEYEITAKVNDTVVYHATTSDQDYLINSCHKAYTEVQDEVALTLEGLPSV